MHNQSANLNNKGKQMALISKLVELLPDDADILLDEYKNFLEELKTYPKDKKYYVYWLCEPDGTPFYIGKGSGKRAWSHLFQYVKQHINPDKNNKELGIQYLINDLKEYPIVYIAYSKLTEDEALQKEAEQIQYYGRFSHGGILTNVMPGGALTDPKGMAASYGGRLGGRKTKDSNKGIFDPSYDRSAQSKKNWGLGLLDHIDFAAGGAKGGKSTRERNSGIFREDLQEKRSEWAKIGAEALGKSGNRSGCCTKEWWQNPENRNAAKERNSKREIQPCTTWCKFPWWTNKVVNKRSLECPGEGFVLGMTRRKNMKPAT